MFPVAFFFNGYRKQRKFMRIEAQQKKTFLSRVNEQSYISFRKFSKRTNLGWLFQFFTFGSQRRLVELPSYGEYDQLFI